ncbi:MAG: 3-deoxy-manno-octulosonate cytidylyltransferase [Candidatus Melainabacteria bacterium]|nr:3-deoxy-manno-octulosonate cytidylyltransferase [Candidatus Melainabacteria bacterium]
MTTAIIIPARFGSTRFPGKPLVKIAGKPMIEWVINAACGSKLANKIIVATDDKRIVDFVDKHSALKIDVCLTSKDHKCGTDRISEVAEKYPEIKYVVNLQGDEPLMPSEYIDKVIEVLTSGFEMSTLVTPITNLDDLTNPSIVKVVMDKNNFALYFSRSPIPYKNLETSKPRNLETNSYFRHIGIYAYTRETLLKFSNLPPSKLEELEQLEQLRALENGIKIKLEVVPKSYPAVDRPEDIKAIEDIFMLSYSKGVI